MKARPYVLDVLLTHELLQVINDQGESVLYCHDCGRFWIPGPLRRYGDHACPVCDSTDTGCVTEENL